MTQTTSHQLTAARRAHAPGMVRLFLQSVWSTARAPVGVVLRARRLARQRRSGVSRPHRWRSRPYIRLATLATGAFAVLFIAWLLRAVMVFIFGAGSDPLNLDSACRTIGVSCGAVIGFGTTVTSVAFAATVFWLLRFTRVRRWYQRRARKHARDLVSTAGTLIGKVVGRDEICDVVMEDLHDRKNCRPHVLVGGVGTGKTAVLVRLTQLLARRGAVPVPIQLRGTKGDVDFAELAQRRFLEEVDGRLVSRAQGERIWRQLRRNGQIVVLADGLEEALVQEGAELERDNILRLAIRRAYQARLPLFITSRPHDPLRGMDATIADLEALSEEAALMYLGGADSGEDERRLDWIVETAGVAEAPLYLQITKQLYRVRRLHQLVPGQRGALNTRSKDRSTLRLWLLKTWEDALVQGYLYGEVPLKGNERKAAMDQLSMLACVGLSRDKLEVKFEDEETKTLWARLEDVVEPAIDVRLAATWGAQLGVVKANGGGVRFPHSLMQAYLGSRLIRSLLVDTTFLDDALRKPGPGRELLIALVLHSRAGVTNQLSPADTEPDTQITRSKNVEHVRDVLVDHAMGRDDNKALDMFAAALEIDSVTENPTQTHIADKLCQRWPGIWANDPRTLEEGKLGLVHRIGESCRMLDARRVSRETTAKSAYTQLFLMGCSEPSYAIRLAMAQEIGAGGYAAYKDLRPRLMAPCDGCADKWNSRALGAPHGDQLDAKAMPNARLMGAWLAPLLVGSVRVGDDGRNVRTTDVAKDLDQWLEHVIPRPQQPGEQDLLLSEEIALAQGFKYAANRRRRHPHARDDSRAHLAEQALQMLKGAQFWFSQLTLIQALCLWSLREDHKEHTHGHGSQPRALVEYWLECAGSMRTNAARRDSKKSVAAPLHPFVATAAELAILALETGQPERFCWIDESGVVSRVGSRLEDSARDNRKHSLWIPPSVGWSTLAPRAQQLVADVLLLLNLAERGEQPSEVEQRQERANRHDLPPCLVKDRGPLDPERTVGTAYTSTPGTNCVDGCHFELCPYPPKGAQPARVELSEGFCRRQRTLLNRKRLWRRRTGSCQGISRRQLQRFWTTMADRARGTHTETDAD